MVILKANEVKYDCQLIISDAKCKRSGNGPLPIMGPEEVDTSTSMEDLDALKMDRRWDL